MLTILESNVSDFAPQVDHIPIQINRIHQSIVYRAIAAVISVEDRKCNLRPHCDWENYLASQPAWIQTLLGQIKLQLPIEQILEIYDKEGEFVMVSDGSEKEWAMTFGWILAVRSGIRLAKAAGPCSGRGSSLRAESAGMLAISLFVGLLFQYFHRTEVKVICISDNAELIKRQIEHLEYDIPYTNMSLKAEFDLTEQIYLSHKALNIQANFQHVKGHQDKNKKKKDLPLFAQLNIEADQEAGDYRLQFGKFCQ